MNELEHRHSVEEGWHDAQAKHKTVSDLYQVGVLTEAETYACTLLGDVSGKIIVDFGCREVHNVVRFPEQGATVYAFDISSAMVKVTRKNTWKEICKVEYSQTRWLPSN